MAIRKSIIKKRKGMRKIDKIIIHCSATPRGRDVKAADIDRWHRERGFKCIGYHYVIGIDGSIERGRDETMVGAHCKDQNGGSIGICYVGGLSSDGKVAMDTRSDEQRVAMTRLVMELRERYPGARVYGHRDFAAKECPCFDVQREFE